MSTPLYMIRIGGHLDDHWSGSLAGLTITRDDDGTSTLRGPLADQAQLHGVLTGLRDLGATLLDLRVVEPPVPVLDRPLHTARLTLRPAVADDAAATWAYRRLPDVSQWLSGSPADTDGYRAHFVDPARLARTIVVEHDPAEPTIIGDLMLRREDGWAQRGMADEARGVQAELGWVLDPARRGQGYATEAVRELVRHAFEDLGLRRVVANAFRDNSASVRIMERLGMRLESHAVRESLHRSGRWLDSVGYALLDDEWRAHRGSVGESR